MKRKFIMLHLHCIFFFSLYTLLAQNDPFKVVYHNPNVRFWGIKCADFNNCIAVGDYRNLYPCVFRSIDGGENWIPIYFADTNITNEVKLLPITLDVAYPNARTCVISRDSGYITRSDNGGITWDTIKLPTKLPLIRIFMLHNGFDGLVCSEKELFITKNGGLTWQMIENFPLGDTLQKSNYFVQAIWMFSKDKFYVKVDQIDSNGKEKYWSFITSDGGKNWNKYPGPNVRHSFGIYSYTPIFFVDSLYGWALGTERTGIGDTQFWIIDHTTDGGKSWSNQLKVFGRDLIDDPHFFSHLQDIAFVDRFNGVAVGQFGSVIFTSDGGNNWIPLLSQNAITPYPGPPVQKVFFKNFGEAKSILLIANYVGKILKYQLNFQPVEKSNYEINNVDIYLNQITAEVQIHFNENLVSVSKVEIMNVLGQRFESPLQINHPEGNVLRLDLSNFSSGCYFLIIHTKKNFVIKEILIY